MSSRWWYALPAACIAYYLWQVIQLADNTPKFDDMNDVFGFFKQLALAQTPLQKIGAFFYPNNEHVTLVNHIIYFAQYQLLGEIRFYPLIIIGHLIIIATGCLLGMVINNARRPFYFAVIAIAYINLYYWDSSFKAMTTISNQVVILFSIAVFFALLHWHKYGLALFFALLATFSQGNGILVWPLGLLILLLNNHWQAARWRYTSIWIITTALVIAIYGIARHIYGTPSPVSAELYFSTLQQHPALPFLSTLAFLGSTIFSASHVALAIGMGTGALLIFFYCAWRCKNQPYNNSDALIFVIALFLIASALIVGFTRGFLVADGSAGLESRYKMYSITFVLLALILLCEQPAKPVQRTVLAALMLMASIGIQASSYRVVPTVQHQAQVFRESFQYWLEDGDFKRQAVYFIPMSDHFLFAAEHLHLFDLMQFAPDAAIIAPLPAVSGRTCPPTPASADHCPMTIRHRGNAITVVVDVDTNQQPALPANITLCDAQANAVMEFVTPETPTSRQHWLIPEADIPAGNYRVLFQTAQQPACETQLTKKPRKVKTEMRTLFGGE